MTALWRIFHGIPQGGPPQENHQLAQFLIALFSYSPMIQS
jgi:hypothetical protein